MLALLDGTDKFCNAAGDGTGIRAMAMRLAHLAPTVPGPDGKP